MIEGTERCAGLSLLEHEDGYRYQLWSPTCPATIKGWRGQNAYIDVGHHPVHARVEDCIRTGSDTGIGRRLLVDCQGNEVPRRALLIHELSIHPGAQRVIGGAFFGWLYGEIGWAGGSQGLPSMN